MVSDCVEAAFGFTVRGAGRGFCGLTDRQTERDERGLTAPGFTTLAAGKAVSRALSTEKEKAV